MVGKSGIYTIRNLINNKIYIGSSVNIYSRWHHHKKTLNNKNHHSQHLQSAWNKYGKENFEFKIIEVVDRSIGDFKQIIIDREQFYLDKFKPFDIENGYNICKSAGSPLGYKHTENAKAKMKLNHHRKKGKEHPNYGRKLTDEHKQKISSNLTGELNPFYKKTHSYETKSHFSNIRKGKNTGKDNPNYGKGLKGEKHFNAKLTSDDVIRIREMLKSNAHKVKEIALLFGVSDQAIYGIKYGNSWKSVKI